MELAILTNEQNEAIETEIAPMLQMAQSLVVKNPEQRDAAMSFKDSLKSMREKIESMFKPTENKKKAYQVYESLLAAEHAFYDPIDEAVKVTVVAIKKFDTDEAIRVRREAQEAEERRAQKEREEREAKEAAIAAEEQRILAEAKEAQRQKDEAAKLKESAIAEGNTKVASIAAKEEAKFDKKAEEIQSEGAKKIDALKTKAEEVPATKFTPPPVKTKNLVWKARVTNMTLLCKSIANGNVPFTVVMVSPAALNNFAKSYDGKTKIEGLEFSQETARI